VKVRVSPTAATTEVGVKERALFAPMVIAWFAAKMPGMRVRKRALANIVKLSTEGIYLREMLKQNRRALILLYLSRHPEICYKAFSFEA
jgi:hypothetical protein